MADGIDAQVVHPPGVVHNPTAARRAILRPFPLLPLRNCDRLVWHPSSFPADCLPGRGGGGGGGNREGAILLQFFRCSFQIPLPHQHPIFDWSQQWTESWLFAPIKNRPAAFSFYDILFYFSSFFFFNAREGAFCRHWPLGIVPCDPHNILLHKIPLWRPISRNFFQPIGSNPSINTFRCDFP